MPSGGQRVYIGNLPNDCRERDIDRFFKGYGRIKDVIVKNGYGFVEFEDHRDADDAVHDLDGKDLLGGRVRVELAKDPRARNGRDRDDRGGGGRFNRDGRRGNPPGPRTKYRIIVENVSSRTSWQDLKDFFRKAGDITYTNVHNMRQGEGIVEFSNRKGMDYALDHKDEHELDGRKLKVRAEKESKSRSRSRSDSRGRSRSASRSKSRSRSRSPRAKEDRAKEDRAKSRSASRSRSRSATPDKDDKDDKDDN